MYLGRGPENQSILFPLFLKSEFDFSIWIDSDHHDQRPRRMDTYTYIVVIVCIALFAINLVFSCFTCFSILHSFMTETTNQDFSDLRKNLIETEEAKPDDEKVMILAVSSNQGFSGSINGDDCGQDCSHDICACWRKVGFYFHYTLLHMFYIFLIPVCKMVESVGLRVSHLMHQNPELCFFFHFVSREK